LQRRIEWDATSRDFCAMISRNGDATMSPAGGATISRNGVATVGRDGDATMSRSFWWFECKRSVNKLRRAFCDANRDRDR
jgi:hypothetical protein